MDKIIEKINKELEQAEAQIVEKGLTKEKLDLVKDLLITWLRAEEVKEKTQNVEHQVYGGNNTQYYDDYDRGVRQRIHEEYPNWKNRSGWHDGLKTHVKRIHDGVEEYENGKNSYHHGDNDDRMIEGLERLMFGVNMLVESALDFAESPQEREVIRRHIHKLKNL